MCVGAILGEHDASMVAFWRLTAPGSESSSSCKYLNNSNQFNRQLTPVRHAFHFMQTGLAATFQELTCDLLLELYHLRHVHERGVYQSSGKPWRQQKLTASSLWKPSPSPPVRCSVSQRWWRTFPRSRSGGRHRHPPILCLSAVAAHLS